MHGSASTDASRSAADRLVDLLGERLDYDAPDRSFSPHWSDIGLGFDGSPGVATLYLHYNRVTRALGAPFLEAEGRVEVDRREALQVRQTLDRGTLGYAFGETNTFVLDGAGTSWARFAFLDDPDLERLRVTRPEAAERRYTALLPTLDARDPDRTVPIVVAVRLLHGQWDDDAGTGRPGRVVADDGGRLVACVSVAVLEVDDDRIALRLDSAPHSLAEAVDRSREWLAAALGSWTPEEPSPGEARLGARAAATLLMNTCASPGNLAGRLASFPSRGGYPVHFLWDSCFHVLGLEAMAPKLATDALEVLTDNLRADGKMPHFVTSTWLRPHASQPPLVGWAAARLVDARHDLDLARRLLGALDANNRWWLEQRGTRFDLVACEDPFETGWDDSPRLDDGPILALDMNAYLLRQLRVTTRFAAMLGEHALASVNEARAQRLDAAMLRTLYDAESNLFLDADAASGERRPLLTPACFLPLWAGVPLEPERARAMICDVLLDPERFFGGVPFPSVAYDDPLYDPGGWWRGPTWPPIVVLMLELLRTHGFETEADEATERIYALLLRDGELHELFDSGSGEGLGQREQGWTAALFLWLARRRAGGAP